MDDAVRTRIAPESHPNRTLRAKECEAAVVSMGCYSIRSYASRRLFTGRSSSEAFPQPNKCCCCFFTSSRLPKRKFNLFSTFFVGRFFVQALNRTFQQNVNFKNWPNGCAEWMRRFVAPKKTKYPLVWPEKRLLLKRLFRRTSPSNSWRTKILCFIENRR